MGKKGKVSFLPHPPLSFFASRFIFRAAKTENPVPRSFFTGYSSTRSWRSCSRGSKTNPNFQMANKPSWISPHDIYSVVIEKYSLFFISEEQLGKGRGALLTFFPRNRERSLFEEREGAL